MSQAAVKRVCDYLATHAPELQVMEFEASTATAPLAAAAIGCEVGAIVKSLCFVVDGQPVMTLVAGDMKVDDSKLAALFGVGRKRVKIADAETVHRMTGFPVGGVSPVAHHEAMPVLIDRTLARYTTVYAAAGSAHANFAIPLPRLVTLTGGRLEDIVKTPV
ncbi:MAG: YbaK/EbsC family protein [Anaerolineae bacterium]|nr:YbaK/EbsC family protein [Anaerolineae bacterium]